MIGQISLLFGDVTPQTKSSSLGCVCDKTAILKNNRTKEKM